MAFLPADKVQVFQPSASTRQQQVAQPQPDDSWGTVVAANARHYGPVWSFIDKQNLGIEHGLDQSDPQQLEQLNELQRLREHADNEIIDNAPYYKNIVGGIAGFISDPVNLTLAAASGGVSAEMTAGAGIAKTALTVGAAEAGATATSEALLHNVQQTRTLEESVFNSGAAFLFAGALSGVGRAVLSKPAQQAHSQMLKEGMTQQSAEDLYHAMQPSAAPDQIAMPRDDGSASRSVRINHVNDGTLDVPVSGESAVLHSDAAPADDSVVVGSAPRRQPTPIIPEGMSPSETLRRMEGDRLFRIESTVDGHAFTPNMRVATAQTLEARALGQQLMGDTFSRERNLIGEATQVGAWFEKQRNVQKIAGQIERIDDQNFKRFKRLQLDEAVERQLIDEIHAAGMADEFAKVGNDISKALKSRNIFRALVSHAMRNGDDHTFDAVANAARQTRSVVQPHFDKASSLGLFKPEAINSIGDTAASYLPKSYQKQKMLRHKNDVESIMMTDGMRRGLQPEASIAMAQKFFDDLTGLDDSVMSVAHMQLSHDPFKARTALVRDNDINRFLNNDYVDLWTHWGNRVAGETALAERGVVGDGSVHIAMVNDAYQQLINKAHADDAGEKVIIKLRKEQEDVTEDLKHFIKEIRGLRDPVQGWQRPVATSFSNLRKITASIKMAGVLVTSLVDLAAHTYHYGMPTQTKLMTKFVTSPEFREALRSHADVIGVGFERQLNSRMQSIADYTIDSMYGDRHKITQWSDVLARHLPMFSGIAHWNDFGKSLASMGHAVKATKLLLKDNLDQFDNAYLAQDGLGLDSGIDWRARVLDQIKAHGEQVDGVWMPNTGKWTDFHAAQRFEQFLFKKTNSTIITSTPGTIPIVQQNDPFVKTMLQFTTFVTTSHEQLLLAGAQKSTADMATGLLAFLTVGAMVAQAKSYLRDGTFIDDPKEVMFNAIDNSGMLSLPLEINNRMGKLGVGTVQGLFGVGEAKRMATQTPFSAVMGPAAGTIEDVAKLTSDLRDGHLSDKGVRAATRLMPYVSTQFLTKYPMKVLTDETMQAVGPDGD